MQQKADIHVFQGMQQDVGEIRQEPHFLRSAFNIRLTPRDTDTINTVKQDWRHSGFIMTNERGPLRLDGESFTGTLLGYAVLNQYIVVFTHKQDEDEAKPDFIYRAEIYNDHLLPTLLYNGNLNFALDAPIETLVSYESELIQKVYWVDGRNQPRVINIVSDTINSNLDTQFDFVRELQLKETVEVERQTGTSGDFEPGAIQYAFTYFDKFMQESNIFYTTPLYYTSHPDRGANPTDRCSNSFKITVNNPDTNFQYLRIYSIQRTSLDATPIVKRVQDIDLNLLTKAGKEWTYNINNLIPTNHWWDKNRTVDSDPSRSFDPGVAKDYYGLRSFKFKRYSLDGWVSKSNFNVNVDPLNTLASIGGEDTTMLLQYYKEQNNKITEEIVSDRSIIFDSAQFPELILEVEIDNALYYIKPTRGTKLVVSQYIERNVQYTIIHQGKVTSKIVEIRKEGSWIQSVLPVIEKDDRSVISITNDPNDLVLTPTVSYIDTGLTGEAVDPKKLLFVGGESIIAETLCQKDGTLFLGNITTTKKGIVKDGVNVNGASQFNPFYDTDCIDSVHHDIILPTAHNDSPYPYVSTLFTYTGGFKSREYYRLGIQFQHKTGKWSSPIWVGDKQETLTPTIENNNVLKVPSFKYTFTQDMLNIIAQNDEYVKVRPIVVFPNQAECNVPFQGMLFPTLYTTEDRDTNKDLYAQSSWYIRPFDLTKTTLKYDLCQYEDGEGDINYEGMRQVEIQGGFSPDKQFKIDYKFATFHSPDLIFNETNWYIDFACLKLQHVGNVVFDTLLKDIDITVKSAPIGEISNGFIHHSFVIDLDQIDDTTTKRYLRNQEYVSGLYFEDYIVDDAGNFDDANDPIKYYPFSYSYKSADSDKFSSPVKWLVYPWQRSGSLNNDSDRLNGKYGLRSAEIDLKKMSRLWFGNTSYSPKVDKTVIDAQLFKSDQMEIIKVAGNVYQGNVDTLLAADELSGHYFAYDFPSSSDPTTKEKVTTDFNAFINFATALVNVSNTNNKVELKPRIYYKGQTKTDWRDKIGDSDAGLVGFKANIRLKYRSTPHVAIKLDDSAVFSNYPIVEMYRYSNDTERQQKMFGGMSEDALYANMWIPAGEPVRIDKLASNANTIYYTRGDTWYQRYDCLKTYAYTVEDTNQNVEICSTMLESRINLDGRYDRNRGQVNNTYMNPTNFNRLNTVYSQHDNFFTYQLLNDYFYESQQFNTQITWGSEKLPSDLVDIWTDVTLAAVHNMDGDKGPITALRTWNNEIYCFQERGLSKISFNPRVQVQTSDGVPIEIANNYKMEGKQYISDKTGCLNKYSICPTPAGLYFIDSFTKDLQAITGKGIEDISVNCKMTRWFTTLDNYKSNPVEPTVKILYDLYNSDLYIITYGTNYTPEDESHALVYSEKLQQFTSFYSYEYVQGLFNLDNKLYCLYPGYDEDMLSTGDTEVFRMFGGIYNEFFGKPQEFSIEFISNLEPTVHKTFGNIDFRGNMWENANSDSQVKVSIDYLFDYLRVWHDYQDTGIYDLQNEIVDSSVLKRKMGVWRIDVPRDKDNVFDRIQNNWVHIKLKHKAYHNIPEDETAEESEDTPIADNVKVEIYDTTVYYYT